MNKNTQEALDLQINTIFEKYGEISRLETNEKSIIYKFSCDSSKIFNKDDLLSYMGIIKFLLLIKPSYECFIYSFRVGTAKGIKKNILSLINKANASLEYGKYILTPYGDIDWEFKVDIRYITDEDVYDIIKVFMINLLNLAVDINDSKLKRTNEKS